jgi:SAM-dependent methyltransferase
MDAPTKGWFTAEQRNRLEIDYWRDAADERPGPLSVPNVVNKMLDAARFLEFFGTYRSLFRGNVLELGAGQGWASTLLKRLAPEVRVIATDISEFAIASVPEWERLWSVKLDGYYACLSSRTREADSSLDLVFCFGAAHHFSDMPASLREIRRILKPAGAALFLYEPSSPAYIYPLAKWRVNRIRPAVPEDLLIRRDLIALAREAGLRVEIANCFSTIGRPLTSALYYRLLSVVPGLTRIVPCAIHTLLTHAR